MTGASAGVVPALATPRWLDSVPVVIAVAVVVIDVALRLAVLGIIPSNRKPSSAMAWILLILLIPVPRRSYSSSCSAAPGWARAGMPSRRR